MTDSGPAPRLRAERISAGSSSAARLVCTERKTYGVTSMPWTRPIVAQPPIRCSCASEQVVAEGEHDERHDDRREDHAGDEAAAAEASSVQGDGGEAAGDAADETASAATSNESARGAHPLRVAR